jgi:hypothetical protein
LHWRRYRLRLTVWLIRRIIAVLDIVSDWSSGAGIRNNRTGIS